MLHSFRSKVLLAIIGITLATVFAITLAFYLKSSRMIADNYGRNLYGRLEQMGNSFDDSFKEMYYITVQASCDQPLVGQVIRFKAGGDEQALEGIAALLNRYKRRYSEISSVYLALPEEGIIVTSQDYPIYAKGVSSDSMDQIAGLSRFAATPVIHQDPLRSNASFLSFVNTVEDGEGRILGYIMTNVEERAIYYKYLDNLSDGQVTEAVLINGEGRVVSAGNSEKMGTDYENSRMDWTGGNGYVSGKSKSVMGVLYRTGFTGFKFLMEVQMSAVLKDLSEVRYFLGALLLVFLGVSAALAALITNAMFRPVKNLSQAMEQVSQGGLDMRVPVTTGDEIGMLTRTFNEMLDHINQLIEKLLKEEMLKKDAELEALQYQITPHFMYNTLNSIKFAALIKGEKELGQLIGDFVELLQASINKKGTFVTVADEIHILMNYVHLQEFRYEGKLEVIYEIEQEAQGCFVPRLILQPMVENAILHGLDMKKDSRIVISAKVDGRVLYLSVEDNGRGMTPEQIQRLMTSRAKKTSGLSGIGIANIRERLELYYGGDGGIAYESSSGGTRASLYLPAYRNQDEYSI